MKYFSMFAGVGGFEYGIEQAFKKMGRVQSSLGRSKEGGGIEGGWGQSKLDCIGYSEIDTYAIQNHRKHWKGAKNYGDATKINTKELPDFDLLVGGFPCQAFSLAGKRRGFQDTRGTLFFEIARVCADKRPRYFLLENVKGLLSHEDGKTFATILGVFADLGYIWQYEVLNSCNFGVPQNRERVFIIGYLGKEGGPQVFSLSEGPTKSAKKNDGTDEADIKQIAQCSSASPMEFGWTDKVGALRARDYKDPKLVRILTETRTDESKKIRKEMLKKGKDWNPRKGKKIVLKSDTKANTITSTSTAVEHLIVDPNDRNKI